MSNAFIWVRWAVLGVVDSCGFGSSAPASESGSQTDAKAGSENPEAALSAPADKLSSDNPVVVLPKSEDLDRRKGLAALLPTAVDSD